MIDSHAAHFLSQEREKGGKPHDAYELTHEHIEPSAVNKHFAQFHQAIASVARQALVKSDPKKPSVGSENNRGSEGSESDRDFEVNVASDPVADSFRELFRGRNDPLVTLMTRLWAVRVH